MKNLNIKENLQVNGLIIGDGSNLTNLPAASNIADDSITNIDINSNANIEFTKLASLTSGTILVGNASNKATSVSLSGDATLANTGVITIANDVITNAKIDNTDTFDMAGVSVNGTITANTFVGDGANLINLPDATGIVDDTIVNDDINSDANIDFTKLASLTSGTILVGNASNKATSVSLSGDATLANDGAITIENNVITNAKIDNSDSFLFENLDINSTVTTSKVVADNVFTSTISGDPSFPTDLSIDSYSIRTEDNFFGPNKDALIIEKTDHNDTVPDGGIAFTNRGTDGRTTMEILA